MLCTEPLQTSGITSALELTGRPHQFFPRTHDIIKINFTNTIKNRISLYLCSVLNFIIESNQPPPTNIIHTSPDIQFHSIGNFDEPVWCVTYLWRVYHNSLLLQFSFADDTTILFSTTITWCNQMHNGHTCYRTKSFSSFMSNHWVLIHILKDSGKCSWSTFVLQLAQYISNLTIRKTKTNNYLCQVKEKHVLTETRPLINNSLILCLSLIYGTSPFTTSEIDSAFHLSQIGP